MIRAIVCNRQRKAPPMNNGTPPFRADHVGSLLRPAELLRTREQRQQGTISAEALRATEDRSIRDVAKL